MHSNERSVQVDCLQTSPFICLPSLSPPICVLHRGLYFHAAPAAWLTVSCPYLYIGAASLLDRQTATLQDVSDGLQLWRRQPYGAARRFLGSLPAAAAVEAGLSVVASARDLAQRCALVHFLGTLANGGPASGGRGASGAEVDAGSGSGGREASAGQASGANAGAVPNGGEGSGSGQGTGSGGLPTALLARLLDMQLGLAALAQLPAPWDARLAHLAGTHAAQGTCGSCHRDCASVGCCADDALTSQPQLQKVASGRVLWRVEHQLPIALQVHCATDRGSAVCAATRAAW